MIKFHFFLGKGENIWDYFTHNYPDRIRNESNGDVACDSYHNYKEDVLMVKDMGVSVLPFTFKPRLAKESYNLGC